MHYLPESCRFYTRAFCPAALGIRFRLSDRKSGANSGIPDFEHGICFSVLAGWVILGQKLSARELLGCALVFAAVICVQLPDKKKTKQVETA